MPGQALAVCLATLCLAVPDVVVPGTRGVARETRVDATALRARCCVAYEVQAGDTLSSITQKQLGTVKRLRELVALNEDVDPRQLRTGQTLWLPPRDEQAAQQPRTFVFVHERWQLEGAGAPFAVNAKVAPSRYGVLGFVLVPERHLEAYRAACAKGWHEVHALAVAGKLQELVASCAGRRVRDESPVHKVRDEISFARDEKGRYAVTVGYVYFDADGKQLSDAAMKQDEREGGPGKQASLLLLLAAAGGGWLVLRVCARTRRPQVA